MLPTLPAMMDNPEPWMDDKARSQPRHRVLFMSTVDVRFVPIKCKVRDISVRGALIETGVPLWQNAEVMLHVPKIGAVAGDVVWVNNERSGIAFKVMLDPLLFREIFGTKRPSADAPDAPRWQPSKPQEQAAQGRSRDAVSWLREQSALRRSEK